MRMIARVALLAGIAAVAPTAVAQTRGAARALRLGTVQISLGMPEKTAIDALRRQFHVEHARGAGDAWAVLKDGNTFAILSFSGDRLSRVSKTWMTTSERGATILADRLYSIAREFGKEGRTDCSLVAKPYKVAQVEGRIVTLVCGNKSVQLIQSHTQRSAWTTSLQEVLQ